ncbi:unnamed protein product [Heterobilharzia americana]|nr:unnamed protein product [Heterobilharzia americana]
MNGRNLKEVVSFTYLASIITTTVGGGTDKNIKANIGKTARQAFSTLKPVWRSTALHYTALSIKNKIRIFNTNTSQVSAYMWFRDLALYGKYFQQTMDIQQQPPITLSTGDQIVKKNKQQGTLAGDEPPKNLSPNKYAEEGGDGLDWTYTEKTDWGHPMPGKALWWNPKGKRRVGRSRVTWMRPYEGEMKACRQSWSQVEKTAEKRVKCRRVTEVLCSTRNPRHK